MTKLQEQGYVCQLALNVIFMVKVLSGRVVALPILV